MWRPRRAWHKDVGWSAGEASPDGGMRRRFRSIRTATKPARPASGPKPSCREAFYHLLNADRRQGSNAPATRRLAYRGSHPVLSSGFGVERRVDRAIPDQGSAWLRFPRVWRLSRQSAMTLAPHRAGHKLAAPTRAFPCNRRSAAGFWSIRSKISPAGNAPSTTEYEAGDSAVKHSSFGALVLLILAVAAAAYLLAPHAK
jgi:hypothetical protein